ncbi:MAG: FtsQ-type POTRA domain-containing protein [Gemmatimonadetes bacterium]|nr:FtsQ-type POTRA domain-containing protein [Gemmatimonadota bacterium]
MRKSRTALLVLALALAGACVAFRTEIRQGVRRAVPVGEVEFTGLRHLSSMEALAAMTIPAEASYLDRVGDWVDGLVAHPLVLSAEVRRSLPRKITVAVVEREAVALVPTPLLEPVDGEGVFLPIDLDEVRLDLPLVHAPVGGEGASALYRELARLGREDSEFFSILSEVEALDETAYGARLVASNVTFLMPHGVTTDRIGMGAAALADARSKGREPSAVDLRFDGVVVVSVTGQDESSDKGSPRNAEEDALVPAQEEGVK